MERQKLAEGMKGLVGSRSIKQMSLRHMELDGGGSVCAELKDIVMWIWFRARSARGMTLAHEECVRLSWIAGSVTYLLCDLGQVTWPWCVSTPYLEKQECKEPTPWDCWEIKWYNSCKMLESVLGAFWVYKPWYCFGSCSEMLVQTVQRLLSQASKGIGSIWKWECNCGSHLMLSEQHKDHHLNYVLYAICFIWHMFILFLSCHVPMYVTLHHIEHLHGR